MKRSVIISNKHGIYESPHEFLNYFPVGIYLLKVNNINTRTKVWNMFKANNKDTKTTSMVSLLLILNIFHTFVLVFLLLTLNM